MEPMEQTRAKKTDKRKKDKRGRQHIGSTIEQIDEHRTNMVESDLFPFSLPSCSLRTFFLKAVILRERELGSGIMGIALKHKSVLNWEL